MVKLMKKYIIIILIFSSLALFVSASITYYKYLEIKNNALILEENTLKNIYLEIDELYNYFNVFLDSNKKDLDSNSILIITAHIATIKTLINDYSGMVILSENYYTEEGQLILNKVYRIWDQISSDYQKTTRSEIETMSKEISNILNDLSKHIKTIE